MLINRLIAKSRVTFLSPNNEILRVKATYFPQVMSIKPLTPLQISMNFNLITKLKVTYMSSDNTMLWVNSQLSPLTVSWFSLSLPLYASFLFLLPSVVHHGVLENDTGCQGTVTLHLTFDPDNLNHELTQGLISWPRILTVCCLKKLTNNMMMVLAKANFKNIPLCLSYSLLVHSGVKYNIPLFLSLISK